jgi:sugar phosphate isomerase/epimerase
MEFSFQLYSARKFPPLGPFLKKLADYGYTQVEGYGDVYEQPEIVAADLKKYGLTMPTGHFQLAMLQDTSATMKLAETLGVKTLICPAVPHDQRKQSDAGWAIVADTLATLADTYKKAGFGLGWHNHAFEFVPTDTGKLPMNILLDGAPNIEWEVDIAWLIVGKEDIGSWFDKYGRRITAVHVKDLAPEGQNADEDGQADVGFGTLDWQGLYTAIKSKTQTKYFVMEHDNPSDPDRFARRSIASAKSWK